MTDVADALAEHERVRERLPLRTGGAVALTDDRLLVAADGSVTRIDIDEVAEITVEDVDWFLGVLSALLVGYGIYSISRNVALGLAFAVFGAGSLYWTYRKRGKARIKVAGRSKPLSVFPADTGAFSAAMEAALARGGGDGDGDGGGASAGDVAEIDGAGDGHVADADGDDADTTDAPDADGDASRRN